MDGLPRTTSLRRLYSTSTGAASGGSRPSSRRAASSELVNEGNLHPALRSKKHGTSLADAGAQAEFQAKRWVWVPDATAGYVAAYIVDGSGDSNNDDNVTVSCLDNSSRTVSTADLSKMNPPKFRLVEDIASLTFLNEASVVHNLRERYVAEMIYTYSGPFLVAVNPYRSLPIYGQDAIQLYKSRRKEECPPHVFAVAEKAWQNMVGEREGQSILITGESGAGKTENTKKVIQYLTAIAAEAAHALPPSGSASSVQELALNHSNGRSSRAASGRELEAQIIQANPILEAFGNAQTVRNNNSSRFGKFVRIEFSPTGAIAGATIDWYLLEKSRVTARSAKERNFHIFYQLLRGAKKELKRDLLLSGGPEEYEYLKQSRLSIEGVDDTEEWRALEHALNVVGVSQAEQFDLFKVVAAILHMGNIAVTADRSEQAYIRDNSALEKVCHLFGLPLAEFSKALLRPRVRAGREWVTQARTKAQVEAEIGALCKAVYEKAFGHLVDRLNVALARTSSAKSTFIGVLDIAGFEIFETNGFEQLCINYTNEKLQQFFNTHMFVLEQEEYARENIDWQFVNFGLDLQPTIDLIESSTMPNIGILSTLDEECIMPKATDATFTEKLHQTYKKGNRNSVLPSPTMGEEGATATPASKYAPARFAMGFTVTHYAGKVEYRTDGWLDKNKDPLNTNITSVLANSSDKYIASLFEEFKDEEDVPVEAGKPAVGARKRAKKGAFRTVAQRHREQLNSLMSQLRETQPHFVRCIVPNEEKRAGQVNVPLVLDQLRCNGVLEGIRIARLGYPNRLPFMEFRQRYEVLTPGIIPNGYIDGRKACQRMTDALELDSAAFRIGLNKIFFKAGVLAELEERRDELLYDVFTRLQAECRRFVCQRRVRKQLNREQAIRTVQRNARIYLELKAWPWWMLYTKVRPLLAATRTDEALKRKEAELLLVQERAKRDLEEKQKLEELKASLEAERKHVQDALESERALNIDKDAMLIRSKEREAQLEEEMTAMQADLDTLDSQLERALAAVQAGENRYAELKAQYDNAAQQVARLEAESQMLKTKEGTASRELKAKLAEIEFLLSSKTSLNSKLKDLERSLKEKEEDSKRAQQRIETAHADLQAKVAGLQQNSDAQAAKARTLEDQRQSAEQQVLELTRSLADLQSAAKRKDADLTSAQGQLAQLQKQNNSSVSEVTSLKVKVDTLDKQVRDAQAESERLSSAKSKAERELDTLQKLMQAKSSEDVKQKELAALKDREITDLRQQVSSLSAEAASASRRTAEQISVLQSELNIAKQQASAASASYTEAMKDVKALKTRLETVEAALSSAEQSVKANTSELRLLRTKHANIEEELAATRKQRDILDQQASAAKTSMQAIEDRALQAERDRSSWQQQMDTLGDQLEKEMTKRMQLEKSHKTIVNDVEGLQMKIVEQDQYIKGLRKELRDMEAELAKSISLQDKTIVEHVHVLEEAKRYTDKQLSDTQARLASVAQYSRTLEKTKARLQSELEDLTVQNDRERMDDRTMEKTFRKLEEQAEKATKRLQQEERMRQVAEQDVARLTAEVARLRASSPTITSNGIQRTKSAFENIPPAGSEHTINGNALKRHSASLQPKTDTDANRGRILRDLTQAHRDLAAGMDATLSRSVGRH